MDIPYESREPTRAQVEAWGGPVVLEFGNAWCGHCRRAEPLAKSAFASHPGVRHVRIADGSGLPLGRSFRVKLWPTFVFLRDGAEVARVVRPSHSEEIGEALGRIERA
jgi:thioredoxin 1